MYLGAEFCKIIFHIKHLDYASKFLVYIRFITADHIEGSFNICIFSLEFLLHLVNVIEDLFSVTDIISSNRSHEFLTGLTMILFDKPACRSSLHFGAYARISEEDAQKSSVKELH